MFNPKFSWTIHAVYDLGYWSVLIASRAVGSLASSNGRGLILIRTALPKKRTILWSISVTVELLFPEWFTALVYVKGWGRNAGTIVKE